MPFWVSYPKPSVRRTYRTVDSGNRLSSCIFLSLPSIVFICIVYHNSHDVSSSFFEKQVDCPTTCARVALDRQLGGRGLLERSFVLGKLLGYLTVAVVLNNLGAVSNEQLGVDQAVNVTPDGLERSVRYSEYCDIAELFRKTHLEELGLLDALEEVVATTLLLDNIASLVGLFMLAYISKSHMQ